MTEKKINVLVVDDSTLMRRMVTDIINKHPKLNVIGFASDGRSAIEQLEKLKPDVITLDVEMPFMNGLEALREIRRIRPTPTIMLSSLTRTGAEVTIQALELGAVDFIQKPEGNNVLGVKQIEHEIVTKILLASTTSHSRNIRNQNQKYSVEVPVIKTTPKAGRVKTVVIGCSTGGPQALKEVVPFLPQDLPAQFLIVQHMPPKFTDMLAQRLNKISQITVAEARENDTVEAKHALLAPGGYHMTVDDKGKIKLNQEPTVWGVRPAVDITLASAAKVYKEDLICVILTGMGHDGTEGAGVVRRYGGYCIAEDESTSVIFGMPKCVIEAGHANEVVPLYKIASAITNAVYR